MGEYTSSRQVPPASHASSTYSTWAKVQKHASHAEVALDGESLEIAHVVAVARYGSKPMLQKTPQLVERVEKSVEMLQRHLARGDMIYGVNTGYGGSADTRTNDVYSLQLALIQHQQSGILSTQETFFPQQRGNTDDFGHLSMPTSWVKGLMLSRVNSIVRGHSAVSFPVIEAIMALLENDITPVIPLRGSISASGDLQPLSYVAGAIQGSPDIYVRVGSSASTVPASQALASHNLKPVVLAAKEGLGLLNGTAASSSAASLAIYEANHMAILTQALTAMAVEALKGTAESFSPFIANVRPHPGQIEVASNIFGFLQGSKLSSGLDESKDMHVAGLCQDRYPLRTSSQWIGPQLEDLDLATRQISVELNSTTDNPLIDSANDLVHHGGNFQAASITSAMEKTRLSVQMLGKLLFAQGVELLNSGLNKGLPPNLAADDPSLSFTGKGIDINLAAYMSELAYLANPVSSHVQSAELHNQAVNSLALISARYTLQSIEVLAQMAAGYIFALCQALDLRVLQTLFFESVYPLLKSLFADAVKSASPPIDDADKLFKDLWQVLYDKWNASTNEDLVPRAQNVARAVAMALVYQIPGSAQDVRVFEAQVAELLRTQYAQLRNGLFVDYLNITPKYLGRAASKIYSFVRGELGVAFFRGLVDSPEFKGKDEGAGSGREKRTVGSWVSVIYEALRSGALYKPVMDALVEGGL